MNFQKFDKVNCSNFTFLIFVSLFISDFLNACVVQAYDEKKKQTTRFFFLVPLRQCLGVRGQQEIGSGDAKGHQKARGQPKGQ